MYSDQNDMRLKNQQQEKNRKNHKYMEIKEHASKHTSQKKVKRKIKKYFE